MKFQVVPVVLSLGGAFLFSFNTSAQIQLDLDILFDGTNTPPANLDTPWLTATFEDAGLNQVTFTIEASGNLTGTENLKQFYFNFDDALDLNAIGFTHLSSDGAFDLPAWTFAENNLKADGDGKYDVRLDFTTGSTGSQTFNRLESVSYLLTYTGTESIGATSFEFFSQPAGGKGPFLVAAHVQNTTGGGSAWLAADHITTTPIPEPASIALVYLAGAGLLIRRHADLRTGRAR
jgi:hypothetical protein